MDASFSSAPILGTLVFVWIAAWVDFRTFQIPNALSVSGAVWGLLFCLWDGGIAGLGFGLAGLGLGLGLFLPGYLLLSMGAGDVKLMGAVGALLGPERLLWAILFTILAAGATGAIYALAAWRTRGAPGPFRRYAQMLRFLWITGHFTYLPPVPGEALAERIPLAVPIAIGTTVAIFWR